MILFISITMWIICLCLVTRIVQLGLKTSSPVKAEAIVWICLILLSIPLLFRPHEDIYGGQDPGSYLNSSVSYARHQSLFYQDPLLSEVAPESREAFLYGHEGFRKTKGACLWIKDMDKAIVGPWFQPAYPVLMSLFPSMGLNFWILYVAPLFTLFTGLALATLAHQLFKHRRAGFAAFLLYVLNPNTIWHGRCPRPEMIAGFLVFGGITLLMGLIQKHSKYRLLDIILLSLALVAAPFFHITSLMVIIPIGLCLVILMLTGKPLYLTFIPISIIGALIFLFQLQHITDCYVILQHLQSFIANPASLAVLIIIAAVCISITSFVVRTHKKGKPKRNFSISPQLELYIGLGMGVLLAGVFVALYVSSIQQGSVVFQLPILRYLRFTDIKGFVALHSRPLAMLSLFGWISLFLHSKENRRYRWALAVALFPAIICIGSMPHFMYFSRRIQPFVVPVYILSLTSLITLIPYRKHNPINIGFILALAFILLFGGRNRSQLYKVTEHKGFISFLQSFADEIKENDGILLCEYSRIAAPFDHFFGIPTLGLDSDRKKDYSEAEQSWKQIMAQTRPNQPAYFLTPFQTPVSEHFDFTPVVSKKIKYKQLKTFTKLPISASNGGQTLSLYKMQIKGTSEPTQTFPYIKPFGASTMGFKSFSKGRSRVWKISSIHCKSETSTTVPLSKEIQSSSAPGNLLLFFHVPTEDPNIPEVKYGDIILKDNVQWQDLGDNWWLFQSPTDNNGASEIAITTKADIFLSDLHIASKNNIRCMSQLGSDAPKKVTFDCGMNARWCRVDAKVLLPLPSGNQAMVLIYGKISEAGQTLTLASADASNSAVFKDPDTKWQWFSYLIDLNSQTTDRTWIKMFADPPWDPEQERWPHDLGILAGRILVISNYSAP